MDEWYDVADYLSFKMSIFVVVGDKYLVIYSGFKWVGISGTFSQCIRLMSCVWECTLTDVNPHNAYDWCRVCEDLFYHKSQNHMVLIWSFTMHAIDVTCVKVHSYHLHCTWYSHEFPQCMQLMLHVWLFNCEFLILLLV